MKANYIKPRLNIERFDFVQTIASTCDVTPGGDAFGRPAHWSKSTCGWDTGDEIVWAEQCGIDDPEEYFPLDLELEGGICYNNPDGSISIFSS